MTLGCRDVRALLVDGTVPSGEAVEAHLKDCPPCAELVADEAKLATGLGTEDEPTESEMDALLTSVKHEVSRETGGRAWLRSRATTTRLGLAVGAIAALAALVVVASPRADLATASRARLISAMALYGALAFGAMVVALRPLHRPAPANRAGRLLIVAGLAAAAGFALAPSFAGTPLFETGDGFAGAAMACFMFGSVLAVPLLLLGWALDRGGYLVGSRLLLAGAAAGLAGNLFLELHCAIALPAHLMLGHVTVVLALLGAGVGLSLVGRRGGA